MEQRTETRYGVRDVVVSGLGADYLDWRRAVVRLKEAAGLYAARAAGAEVAPGKTLTLVFRESPTTQPASCPPQADGAS